MTLIRVFICCCYCHKFATFRDCSFVLNLITEKQREWFYLDFLKQGLQVSFSLKCLTKLFQDLFNALLSWNSARFSYMNFGEIFRSFRLCVSIIKFCKLFFTRVKTCKILGLSMKPYSFLELSFIVFFFGRLCYFLLYS